MKWIWIIFGVLVLAAGLILWQDARSSERSVPTPSPSPGAAIDRAPVRASGGARASENIANAPTDANTTTGAAPSNASSVAAPAKQQSAPATPPAAASGTDRAMPKIEHAAVAPGNIEKQDDGSLIADKRFRITGSGTAADPYRVSWECLASAQETYVPRLSENVIPERIAMLHGKVVRIDGYVSFPLLLKESSELILMLNQWDGCCIGVPPTPYDAVEVKLAEPVKNTQRHAAFSYGSVTGTLKVEPFLVDNWLVGLYLMEDARYDADGI